MAEMDPDEKLKPQIAARMTRMCRAMEQAQPGLTQGEIGRRAGVHDAGTWSGYLSGRSKVPYEALVGLWESFGVDPFWVINGVTRNNTPEFNRALYNYRPEPEQPRPTPRRGRPPKART